MARAALFVELVVSWTGWAAFMGMAGLKGMLRRTIYIKAFNAET